MKNQIFISLITLLMVSALQVVYSQSLSLEQNKIFQFTSLNPPRNVVVLNKFEVPHDGFNFYSSRSDILKPEGMLDMTRIKQNVEQTSQKEKSIWIGGGLSLLVPGAGEFYAKSYVKAAIFLGVEVLCWSAYAYYNHKGNTKTEEFQNFADANWSMRQYGQWLVDQQFEGYGNIDPNEQNLEILRSRINQCEEASGFSHQLPEPGTQQYYELIGKYQEYVAGWPDARNGNVWLITKQNYYTYKTPMFNSYAESRQQANTYYNDGQTGAMIALLNHVLSAADAMWSVTIFNKNLKVQTGIEIRRDLSPYTLKMVSIPTLKVNVSF